MNKQIQKIVILAAAIKVSAGHQKHITGTGPHQDKRLKRVRTRSQQKIQLKKQRDHF